MGQPERSPGASERGIINRQGEKIKGNTGSPLFKAELVSKNMFGGGETGL